MNEPERVSVPAFVGTFTPTGAHEPHAELVRHPYADISNAPDDASEQRLYERVRHTVLYDGATD